MYEDISHFTNCNRQRSHTLLECETLRWTKCNPPTLRLPVRVIYYTAGINLSGYTKYQVTLTGVSNLIVDTIEIFYCRTTFFLLRNWLLDPIQGPLLWGKKAHKLISSSVYLIWNILILILNFFLKKEFSQFLNFFKWSLPLRSKSDHELSEKK